MSSGFAGCQVPGTPRRTGPVLAPFHSLTRLVVPFGCGTHIPQLYGYWVAGLNKGSYQRPPFGRTFLRIGGRLGRTHARLPGLFRRTPDSFYRVQALRLRR
jgi:hypothetical protein